MRDMHMKIVFGSSKLQILAYWGLVSTSVLLLSGTCRNASNTTNQASEGISSKTFVGPWVASEVDVEIATKNTTGGPDHLHYESKALAADQGRKPAMTIYNADGSYREEIYTLSDSLVQSKMGFWHFYEDSLFMRLDVTGSPKIAFHAAKAGNGLKLSSRLDWDGDGAKDDEMIVSLKRP